MNSSTELVIATGRISRLVLNQTDKGQVQSLLADLRAAAVVSALTGQVIPTDSIVEKLAGMVLDKGAKQTVTELIQSVHTAVIIELTRGHYGKTDAVTIAAFNRVKSFHSLTI